MSSKTAKNSRLLPAKIGASFVSMIIAGFVLVNFAHAVKDGLMWKRSGDWAVVAPDFEAPASGESPVIPDFTLHDRYGNPVSLHQFAEADLLVINLWSSDCPPCRAEMPSLSEMDERIEQLGKVALITITIDEKWDDVAEIFPAGTNLRILFDPENKVTKGIFGTEKFPETFLLDKQRRIRARFDGQRNWHSSIMLDYLKSFL